MCQVVMDGVEIKDISEREQNTYSHVLKVKNILTIMYTYISLIMVHDIVHFLRHFATR